MLILAGVSLNAIIGDNGIITNAQTANMKNGMAVLEEFLQEKYVENYDSGDLYSNKLEMLTNLGNTKKFFQKSSNNEYYFLSTDSYKEYYFIEKSALPDEIKGSIVSGNNSLTGKTIYADFTDIYGITKDLKVFYCSDGYGSWMGAEDTATITDLNKIVFSSDDPWVKILGLSGDATLNDIRSTQSLTLNSSLLDLSKMENFGNLNSVTINSEFNNLNGIEEAPNIVRVYFNSKAEIEDYSALGKMGKLAEIYFVGSNDSEIEKFCNTCKEMDFKELKYLCISSEDNRYYFSRYVNYIPPRQVNQNVTTIEPLKLLSENVKKNLQYLCVSFNSITSLEYLADFTGLYFLNADWNNLKDVKGISEKMVNLSILRLNHNNLGSDVDNEEIDVSKNAISFLSKTSSQSGTDLLFSKNFKNLYSLDLSNNSELIWIDYLKAYSDSNSKLDHLYLSGCEKLNTSVISEMKNFLKTITYTLSNKYDLIFLDDDTKVLNLSNQTVQKDLLLSFSIYEELTELNLREVVILDDEEPIYSSDVNEVMNSLLPSLTKLKYLSVRGLKSLTDFSFLKSLNQLVLLDVVDTGASTLSEENGLQLLNDIESVTGLAISGDDIDLSKLQPTLNRLSIDGYETTITANSQALGLVCRSAVCLKTLERCTELEQINLLQRGLDDKYTVLGIDLDLSELKNVLVFEESYLSLKSIILPPNVKVIRRRIGGSSILDGTNCQNLKEIYSHSGSNVLNVLVGLKNPLSVEKIHLQGGDDTSDFLSKINEVKKCANLNFIRLGDVSYNRADYRISLSSLEALGELSFLENLQTLELFKIKLETQDFSPIGNLSHLHVLNATYCDLSDISFVKNLTSLETANFSDCSINRGIRAIENLSNLYLLNLTRNSLYDLSDFEGTASNIFDTFAKMNYNADGSLQYLYLTGNENLKDFSKISSLTWKEKNGF